MSSLSPFRRSRDAQDHVHLRLTPPPYENVIGPPVEGTESDPTPEALAVPQGVLAVAGHLAEYKYDPAGNRVWQRIGTEEIFYHYNAASQLLDECRGAGTEPPAVTHEYDEWGNEVRRNTLGEGSTKTEEYGYNYLNLMSAYRDTSTGSEWRYDFWPTGERHGKVEVNSGEAELYLPRGGDVATEYRKTGSQSPVFMNRYVQGTGIDQKYVRIPAGGGGRRYYLGDQVGTLSVTLGGDGAVAEVSLKDAWGVQLSGGTPSERYGYAQREHDPESGLVHMRARMYEPRLGRFTQVDPVLENRSNHNTSRIRSS